MATPQFQTDPANYGLGDVSGLASQIKIITDPKGYRLERLAQLLASDPATGSFFRTALESDTQGALKLFGLKHEDVPQVISMANAFAPDVGQEASRMVSSMLGVLPPDAAAELAMSIAAPNALQAQVQREGNLAQLAAAGMRGGGGPDASTINKQMDLVFDLNKANSQLVAEMAAQGEGKGEETRATAANQINQNWIQGAELAPDRSWPVVYIEKFRRQGRKDPDAKFRVINVRPIPVAQRIPQEDPEVTPFPTQVNRVLNGIERGVLSPRAVVTSGWFLNLPPEVQSQFLTDGRWTGGFMNRLPLRRGERGAVQP